MRCGFGAGNRLARGSGMAWPRYLPRPTKLVWVDRVGRVTGRSAIFAERVGGWHGWLYASLGVLQCQPPPGERPANQDRKFAQDFFHRNCSVPKLKRHDIRLVRLPERCRRDFEANSLRVRLMEKRGDGATKRPSAEAGPRGSGDSIGRPVSRGGLITVLAGFPALPSDVRRATLQPGDLVNLRPGFFLLSHGRDDRTHLVHVGGAT